MNKKQREGILEMAGKKIYQWTIMYFLCVFNNYIMCPRLQHVDQCGSKMFKGVEWQGLPTDADGVYQRS